MNPDPDRQVEAAQMARWRQGLYRFFAASLLYPEAPRLATLAAAASTFEGLEAFAFYGAWQKLVQALSEPEEAAPAALEAAYVGVFSVGTKGVLCPLYASSYLAPPGPETGAIMAQLDRDYARFGLSLSPAMRSTPDHIAVELEVMAFLAGREARAWEDAVVEVAMQSLEDQHAFVHRHLGRWIPRFASRVQAVLPDGFYRRVCEAIAAFIVHEADFLDLFRSLLQREETDVRAD